MQKRSNKGTISATIIVFFLVIVTYCLLNPILVILFVAYRGADNLLSEYGTVSVVSADVDLSKGEIINSRNIKMKKVSGFSKEPGAFDRFDDPALIGSTLKVNVLRGQTITRNLVGEPEQKQLPKTEEFEITIVLKGAAAKQAFLQSNRRVSLWVEPNNHKNKLQLLAKKARILEVVLYSYEDDTDLLKSSAEVSIAIDAKLKKGVLPYLKSEHLILLDENKN